MPVNTVRALDEREIISRRYYRPSKSVELDNLRLQLNASQQKLARALADNPGLAKSSAFLAEPAETRAIMAAVAYRYIRLTHRKEQRTPAVAKRSFTLLTLINSLPAVPVPETEHPEPPEKGHGTQMLGVSGGQREGELDFGELTYRLTYHDLLDNQYGFLRGAQIEGLDMTDRKSTRLNSSHN